MFKKQFYANPTFIFNPLLNPSCMDLGMVVDHPKLEKDSDSGSSLASKNTESEWWKGTMIIGSENVIFWWYVIVKPQCVAIEGLEEGAM